MAQIMLQLRSSLFQHQLPTTAPNGAWPQLWSGACRYLSQASPSRSAFMDCDGDVMSTARTRGPSQRLSRTGCRTWRRRSETAGRAARDQPGRRSITGAAMAHRWHAQGHLAPPGPLQSGYRNGGVNRPRARMGRPVHMTVHGRDPRRRPPGRTPCDQPCCSGCSGHGSPFDGLCRASSITAGLQADA